ncbi:YoaK family protein [Chitinivorax sp. B]|uniref:YoaK family protein n=1 Tax=Chitinivorax sp. B TaxID=2502235 RepID=UPI0010F7BFF0|nr:YoaK family protein [Chitinivorax sp. B]
MPLDYLSQLTAPQRSARANLHLGLALAFIAGALNAGGFLAIGQYTSHMTGMLSSAADHLVLGQVIIALGALLSMAAFVAGAATTALLVNYTKRNHPHSIYAPTLMLEALLLLLFGLIGGALLPHEIVSTSLTAILLCYIMGLQNALITKISNAEIRTTHVTGLVTDIGIELGKLCYWNQQLTGEDTQPVAANRRKLRIHLALVIAFFLGAVLGALGFKFVGFSATIPLAIALVALSCAHLFRH